MPAEEVLDELSDQYQKLLKGEKVPFDIAQIYFKENDGFLIRTGDVERAIGMHLVEEGIFVSFMELEEDDGSIVAEEVEGMAFSVDGKVKNRLIELLENAEGRSGSGGGDDPAEDIAKELDYLG